RATCASGCLRGLVAGHNKGVTVPTTQALPHAATAWLRSSLPGCPTASSGGPFVRLPEVLRNLHPLPWRSHRRQRYMKIALVAEQASQLTPSRGRTAPCGGPAHGLVPLAGALAGLGHDVTVYARRDAGSQPSRSSMVPGVTLE